MTFTKTWFERAIFLSWYCSKADCKFCYMSTQKKLIKNPKKARRTFESIIAESIITKSCGWKIEFLSGGYESYSQEELLNLIKNIYKIYGKKLWLNLGVLSRDDLKAFLPYIDGVCGAVETVNPEIHKRVCPSKPVSSIERMFETCKKLKLKKAITIILGLGETLDDFELLKRFIEKHKISKVTFYALKPHKGTPFEGEKGPGKHYYSYWVSKTRAAFPDIEIVAGSWLNRLDEIHILLNAGANAITKFPAIKQFNSEYAKKIELEAKKAKREFTGTLTKKPKLNLNEELSKLNVSDEVKKKIGLKVKDYVKKMCY